MNQNIEAELTELRAELEAKHADLSQRLERIEGHLRHKNGPLDADWEEQATERENDEVLEALDDVGRLELEQTANALRAMNEGTYGECKSCGEDINIKRLRVLPFTPVCIKCAREAER